MEIILICQASDFDIVELKTKIQGENAEKWAFQYRWEYHKLQMGVSKINKEKQTFSF